MYIHVTIRTKYFHGKTNAFGYFLGSSGLNKTEKCISCIQKIEQMAIVRVKTKKRYLTVYCVAVFTDLS